MVRRLVVNTSSLVFALALAACSSMGGMGMTDMPAKKAADGTLTNAAGMTLYTFDKDEKDKTNCYDKCAVAWPPLAAAADAKADDEWTIVDRTDGTKMWAYDGKPVYTFIKDKKAGDVTGDGVGEVWHIVKAD